MWTPPFVHTGSASCVCKECRPGLGLPAVPETTPVKRPAPAGATLDPLALRKLLPGWGAAAPAPAAAPSAQPVHVRRPSHTMDAGVLMPDNFGMGFMSPQLLMPQSAAPRRLATSSSALAGPTGKRALPRAPEGQPDFSAALSPTVAVSEVVECVEAPPSASGKRGTCARDVAAHPCHHRPRSCAGKAPARCVFEKATFQEFMEVSVDVTKRAIGLTFEVESL